MWAVAVNGSDTGLMVEGHQEKDCSTHRSDPGGGGESMPSPARH
jgi:hypothetical protein